MVTLTAIDFKSKDGEALKSTMSFKRRDLDEVDQAKHHQGLDGLLIKESVCFKKKKPSLPEQKLVKANFSFKNLTVEGKDFDLVNKADTTTATISSPEPTYTFPPRPISELNEAAIKVQKAYKSYRTRRNLADCAVVVEELWWKALDFAALRRSSISFFQSNRSESAVSRWARARTRVAKLGKGLSKDEKAQKLALRHWLEAIDPRHRYGHNLHLYYDVWFESESSQPFFYWLDVGDGKEVNIQSCSRTDLQRQCIKYLGPREREAYEVIVESGKLVYRQSRMPVETMEGTKWIFVLSASRNMYVGQKVKGSFQHSSFLSGGAAIAAGRLVAHGGVLEAIWSYSGHYRPTEDNFMEFISFLEDQHVDMTNVTKSPIDDDIPPSRAVDEELKLKGMRNSTESAPSTNVEGVGAIGHTRATANINNDSSILTIEDDPKQAKMKIFVPSNPNNGQKVKAVQDFEVEMALSFKWTTGAGPRIGCVREYPTQLQIQALEQVNLSPRVKPGSLFASCGPIPSPRPSPKVHLSPRIACLGLSSPRTQ